MSGAKLKVPYDRICYFLFGLLFACIGIFGVLIIFNDVLLGLTEVSGNEFWATLLFMAFLTLFAVIGLSEMLRAFTMKSHRLSLRKAVAADGACLAQ